jgi:hypothetical protein
MMVHAPQQAPRKHHSGMIGSRVNRGHSGRRTSIGAVPTVTTPTDATSENGSGHAAPAASSGIGGVGGGAICKDSSKRHNVRLLRGVVVNTWHCIWQG